MLQPLGGMPPKSKLSYRNPIATATGGFHLAHVRANESEICTYAHRAMSLIGISVGC
jgi:hypothetical protein